MQNLNDLNNLKQTQKAQTVQEIPDQESARKIALSKFGKFVKVVWIIIIILLLIFIGSIIINDNSKTQKQIKEGVESYLNSPEIQAQRSKEARRQREIAKLRRLK